MVIEPELLSDLNAEQVRELVTDLIAQVARNDQQISARNQQIDALDQQITSLEQTLCSKDREILYRQAKIEQLTHEMALLKRWKFGKSDSRPRPERTPKLASPNACGCRLRCPGWTLPTSPTPPSAPPRGAPAP